MRKTLLVSAAATAALAFTLPAAAQDEVDAGADGAMEIDLAADKDVHVGIGADFEAAAVTRDSAYEAALKDATVTSEAGAALGTVESCEFGEDDQLETIVIKDTQGDLYDLAATDATFDASTGTLTTARLVADLEPHRNALEELGDQIEDAVDGDASPEDMGPDHHPDANDVDDPEIVDDEDSSR